MKAISDKKYALVNCDIYTGNEVYSDKAILINGYKIDSILNIADIPETVEVVDLQGLSVAPGFIDIQVNGGGGVLFNDDPSSEGIDTIRKAHNRFGTIYLLPTLITSDGKTLKKAIKAVEQAIKEEIPGIIGIHIEGPFINKKKAGVHDKENIREISKEDYEIIRSLATGKTLLTIAPEVIEEGVLGQFIKDGIVVSAGHTNANYEQAKLGFKNGIKCATHLFNAMSQLQSRDPGMIGAVYENQNVWCGIIADGYHVHFSNIYLTWKQKVNRKLILVTDAMPVVGTDAEEFKLNGIKILVKDGKCTTEDGTLAGSALDMATAVRNCVRKVGIPKDEVLRMASTYPAELLGLDNRIGKIAPGYEASLVIFNNEIVIKGIIIKGSCTKY